MLCFYPRPLFGADYVLRPALKFTFKEFCHGSSEGCIAVAAVITMNIYLLKSSLAVLGLCPLAVRVCLTHRSAPFKNQEHRTSEQVNNK